MSVRIPRKKHVIVSLLIGFLEGLFFIVGDAVAKQYGLVYGFGIIVVLNALIYLVAVTKTR